MLSKEQSEQIVVVLVAPRNPLNIGAAARAMANFGLRRLTVVAPYAPHWREARSAVGAPEVLESAVLLETLAEAVGGCSLVAGTGTLTYRKPEQIVARLPEFAPVAQRHLDCGGRIALVFGPEKHGLTRNDLSYCHMLVEIPTDAGQPSMNLGQAVAVCLYELAARCHSPAGNVEMKAKAQPIEIPSVKMAASDKLELLAGVVGQVMVASHYSPASMREANRHDLRLLLRRLAPSDRDTRRILGLFRRILWRLK